MRALLDKAGVLLDLAKSEADVVRELVQRERISKGAAEYVLAQVKAERAAAAAPKSTVRAARLAAAADAFEREGGLVQDRRASALDRRFAQEQHRESAFLAEFERIAAATLANKVVVRPSAIHRKKSEIKRAVNLVLSDLHFGANLDPAELPRAYSAKEEARRFAHVMQQTADYKPQYRDHSSLNVHLLGDVVQNQLHDPRDGQPLAAQAMAATSYLVQGLAYQAAHWREVDVYCATGNHGRFTSRHPGRGIHQKWDSLETVVYHGAKLALQHLPNVRFHLSKAPYYVWPSFGQHGFGAHGDTVLNPGQPGKSIDISRLEAQVHEINDGFRNDGKPPCSLFVHGHSHRAYDTDMDTGETIVGNGALIPPDGYAVSLGKLSCACSQTLVESVPGFIFGDKRKVRVGRKQDGDATLEAIVRPFEGI